MDIDIKEEDYYDTTEAGCVKHHPKHALLHWTGCYIEDCKIHTKKPYEPKPPSWAQICTYCGQYGHKVINCNAHNKMMRKLASQDSQNRKLEIQLDAPSFKYQIISTKIIPRPLNPNSAGRSYMKALLPPKPNSQTNRNCPIYLPPSSKDTNMYGTTVTTPA